MRAEEGVEPANAGEAAGQGDLDQRQIRLGDQLLRQQEAARLSKLDRRDAVLLADRSPELSRAEAKLTGERLQAAVAIERLGLDPRTGEPGRASHGIDRGMPRRQLGPATQAGAEAHLFSHRGVGKKSTSIAARRARRTDRPAVDAGGRHAHEEKPVKPHVAGGQGTVTGFVVEFHDGTVPLRRDKSRHFRTYRETGLDVRKRRAAPIPDPVVMAPAATTENHHNTRSFTTIGTGVKPANAPSAPG